MKTDMKKSFRIYLGVMFLIGSLVVAAPLHGNSTVGYGSGTVTTGTITGTGTIGTTTIGTTDTGGTTQAPILSIVSGDPAYPIHYLAWDAAAAGPGSLLTTYAIPPYSYELYPDFDGINNFINGFVVDNSQSVINPYADGSSPVYPYYPAGTPFIQEYWLADDGDPRAPNATQRWEATYGVNASYFPMAQNGPTAMVFGIKQYWATTIDHPNAHWITPSTHTQFNPGGLLAIKFHVSQDLVGPVLKFTYRADNLIGAYLPQVYVNTDPTQTQYYIFGDANGNQTQYSSEMVAGLFLDGYPLSGNGQRYGNYPGTKGILYSGNFTTASDNVESYDALRPEENVVVDLSMANAWMDGNYGMHYSPYTITAGDHWLYIALSNYPCPINNAYDTVDIRQKSMYGGGPCGIIFQMDLLPPSNALQINTPTIRFMIGDQDGFQPWPGYHGYKYYGLRQSSETDQDGGSQGPPTYVAGLPIYALVGDTVNVSAYFQDDNTNYQDGSGNWYSVPDELISSNLVVTYAPPGSVDANNNNAPYPEDVVYQGIFDINSTYGTADGFQYMQSPGCTFIPTVPGEYIFSYYFETANGDLTGESFSPLQVSVDVLGNDAPAPTQTLTAVDGANAQTATGNVTQGAAGSVLTATAGDPVTIQATYAVASVTPPDEPDQIMETSLTGEDPNGNDICPPLTSSTQAFDGSTASNTFSFTPSTPGDYVFTTSLITNYYGGSSYSEDPIAPQYLVVHVVGSSSSLNINAGSVPVGPAAQIWFGPSTLPASAIIPMQ